MKSVCVILALMTVTTFVSASELTLSDAKKIADKASEYAKKKKWSVAIAIVNSEGNLLYFQRDEKSYSGAIEASIQKAKSSNAFQRPTKAFVDGIKEGRIGLVTVKDIVAIEGGLPIVLGGAHVGAIGVSGAKATEDEECAKAALEQIK
jgi:glc operon protein GlcG